LLTCALAFAVIGKAYIDVFGELVNAQYQPVFVFNKRSVSFCTPAMLLVMQNDMTVWLLAVR
jgi:hypothetical protein